MSRATCCCNSRRSPLLDLCERHAHSPVVLLGEFCGFVYMRCALRILDGTSGDLTVAGGNPGNRSLICHEQSFISDSFPFFVLPVIEAVQSAVPKFEINQKWNPEPWTSILFMAKGHSICCGLVRGPHLKTISKWYTHPTKLLCNFYRIYIIYKYGRGLETHDLNQP